MARLSLADDASLEQRYRANFFTTARLAEAGWLAFLKAAQRFRCATAMRFRPAALILFFFGGDGVALPPATLSPSMLRTSVIFWSMIVR